ncbi:nuclear transport factor 2 family protein [Rhodobiaceae bacterium]|jgi:hypothetical protein|nr:nuclear transport factor 2 family protein [Rhodobiaceae bacterium]
MRKLFLMAFLGLLITTGFNVQSKTVSAESRFEIIDVMNKYAIGIDTKDYKLFRSIFYDDVEVSIVYTPNFGTGNTVNIKGADNWVNYVDSEISKFRNTQHMLGNPMISYDGKVAIVRTDLRAIHYYANKPDVSTTFWGYYETHMINEGEWKVIKHTLTGIGAN